MSPKLKRFAKTMVMLFLISIAVLLAMLMRGHAQPVTIKLKEPISLTATPVQNDNSIGEYLKGTITYRSLSYTVVKLEKDKKDEKQFTLTGLKPGKSTIVISCKDTEGKTVKISFVATVTTGETIKPVEGFYIKMN